MLDVGSCFNPFKEFPELEVTAVDLCPAASSVWQCDFLRVPVASQSQIEDGRVSSLQAGHFDCVVFSFLLEYLPSTSQRWRCCCKAHQLLQNEGLLVVITPDSKAAHSNAKVMKSWREALASIGFRRIKYEKLQHAHCMAFRKEDGEASLYPDDPVVSAKMYIPQDFQQFADSEDDARVYMPFTPEELAEGFAQLPATDDL